MTATCPVCAAEPGPCIALDGLPLPTVHIERDTTSTPIHARFLAALAAVEDRRADLFRRNLAAMKHELETPMRSHDADGACCRAAIAAARAQAPTPPSAGPGR